MIDPTDLKRVVMFGDLNDEMLKEISDITDLVEYSAGDYIFQKGTKAEFLYSVLKGKVELEFEFGSDSPIHLQGIIPNFIFGISSVVTTDEKLYINNAKVLVDSEIYQWKAADLETLFAEDHQLGYLFMKRIAKALKTRFTAKDTLLADIYKYVRSNGKSF